jgi:response regulator RpfG family c-di-GMP phosphodiesterase
MKPRILCVDDEPLVLAGQARHLSRHFDVDSEESAQSALLRIRTASTPYAVVVSDYNMPGMDGIAFLAEVRAVCPDTARVILTGRGDLYVAMQAVNEGSVFRFLTKPASPEVLLAAVEAGVHQYELAATERELLQKTLTGSVKMLADLLSLTNPIAFGRSSRVYRVAQRIAPLLCRPEESWAVLVAAMLCQIGCVAVPGDVLERAYRRQTLSPEQEALHRSHPSVGRELLAAIPRLERVAEIVGYQSKHYSGGGFPDDDREGDDLPLGSRIIHAALDYDAVVSAGGSPADAVRELRMRGSQYDPAVIAALASVTDAERGYEERRVGVDELSPEMILAEDIESPTGMCLIVRGQEMSPALQSRLRQLVATGRISGSFRILAPAEPV